MPKPHGSIFSILIILGLAIAAVVGSLLVMGQLAKPETSVAGANELTPEPIPLEKTAEPALNNDEVVATVNGQIITRAAWQKATRLDAVMNRLAQQPLATNEETLDRLINEIIVLEAGSPSPASKEDIEARIQLLTQNWQVTDQEMVLVLEQAGLNRADLVERVGRLIQVEAALNQLAGQEGDLNAWLAQTRSEAEIGLYHSLVTSTSSDLPPEAVTPNESAADESPALVSPSEIPTGPYANKVAPDFTLPQLNGEPLALSDFRGQPAILNFWASWCPPCKRELPALQAAYAKYGDKIGLIAVDVKEDPAAVAVFVEELELNFPVALDPDGAVSDLTYEVRGIPTTLFIDANGLVAARHVGPLDEAVIDTYLTPLLEQAEQQAQAASQTTPDENDEPTSIETDEVSTETDEAAQAIPADEARSGNDPHPPTETPPVAAALAPDFSLTAGSGEAVSLQDYRDKRTVVLVFYRGQT
ncbi:MAG: redoxin domain-containing protein [Anaerolineae bacterium]|nr:redoxin domain-containing protein [Anaerolineae bacterium]